MPSRRTVLTGALSSVALAAMPFGIAQGRERFPLLAGGRLVPRDLSAYRQIMMSGGPGKDGIPSIDAPAFWSAAEAGGYLDDGDIVFGLVEGGTARAYPQRVLVWHEIVNDTIGMRRLAVTYCPLTGTAIAFERNDTAFGVSGSLVNSNLVMYDRDTDTWFPQVLAVGISGPHAGGALVERPLVWTTWERWRAAYPRTDVLSTKTGFARNYERDPYGAYNPPEGYYAPDSARIFPVLNEDDRFAPKTMVLGGRTADVAVAFDLATLRREGQLIQRVGGDAFTAVYDPGLDTGYIFRGASDARATMDGALPGSVRWSDGRALEPVNTFQAMWFAWAAFYPGSAVHA
ncbi:hypothetical protein ABIE65_005357 [Constrictibacter sp. MBR-5]|jgi:hypothetical protein|uniref:DUF3179 domain-containing protein n=1 Tax=Constrictibacter sp. MBR-5 TaxID=3156467 RepID=UPI0033944A51